MEHAPVVVKDAPLNGTVSSSEVTYNFSSLARRLKDGVARRIVVERYNKPEVVMLSIHEYDALCRKAQAASVGE